MNDSLNTSKLKKDILKQENDKRNRTYDSDFSEYSKKEAAKKKSDTKATTNTKKRYSSDSESTRSSIDRKKTTNTKRKESYSRSRSRSSSSRSKTPSSYSDKKYKSTKSKTVGTSAKERGRSYSPSVASANSRNKLKAYSTQEKRTPLKATTPNDRNSLINRSKKNAAGKLKAQSYHSSSVDPLNSKASRIISAQRVKNNDLQNRISEMNIELEKLREENRTLKRVHRREEVALKKLESQDTDVNRIVKGYQDEIGSLKQSIRKMHNDNRRVSNNILEREDELRVLKKKYSELKDILNDKKLIDSAELSKKLEICEQELNDQKAKCQNMERRLEITEKNHKHEIGVEIAHHKETQKQLQKINEEMKEIKVKLEEKERALDAMNIYSRANREANPPPIPLWKMSSTSLNGVQESPHDKRREYDRKVKEKNQKTVEKKLDSERKMDSDRREKPPVVSNHTNIFDERREDDDEEEAKRKLEMERRRLEEEEAELRRKDAAERQRREQKEKDEKERIERMRREALEHEAERKRKQHEKEKEDEERRLREKAILEEKERKKRWVVSDLDENPNEKQKKDDLLAKLFSTETPAREQEHPIVTPVPQPVVKKNIFDTSVSSSSSKPSNGPTSIQQLNNSNNNNDSHNKSSVSYKFPTTIENLHEGKPANSIRDDDLFSNHSQSNNKNDLMDKLFGGTGTKTSSNNNSYFQNRLDSLEDFPDTTAKKPLKSNLNSSQSFKGTTQQQQQQQQNSSKVPFLPWDIPDAQVGTPSSTKKPSNENTPVPSRLFENNTPNSGLFGTPPNNSMRRPKETNSIFTSNKINNANSHNFIEDIEELAL